jgi:hypothetical protein
VDRLSTVEEEIRLFREYCQETDVGKRQECYESLHQFLAERLQRLARGKDGEVREEFVESQARILRCVTAQSSGDWRSDLCKLRDENLDQLVLLCSTVADDVWAEAMIQILRRRLSRCGLDDQVAGGMNLVQEALCRCLSAPSRAALMAAVLRPQVAPPVCVWYCVKSIVRGEWKSTNRDRRERQQAEEYTKIRQGDVEPPETKRHIAKDRTLGEVLALPGVAQAEVIRRAWAQVAGKHHPPLWLSDRFQAEGMDEVMDGIASPVPPHPTGAGIEGREAADILGISRDYLHKKVHQGNQAFRAAVQRVMEDGIKQKGVGK